MTATESYNGESRQRKSTIIRRKLSTNYTTVPNEIFDHGLSPTAICIFVYLIGRPRDWRVIPHQLCEQFGIGRDKVRGSLNELITVGLIHRSKSADGSIRYTVFDQPTDPKPENPSLAFNEPAPENPSLDPKPENPKPENPSVLLKKDRYQEQTEKKEAPSTERARANGHDHVNGTKQSGSDKEASKRSSNRKDTNPTLTSDLTIKRR